MNVKSCVNPGKAMDVSIRPKRRIVNRNSSKMSEAMGACLPWVLQNRRKKIVYNFFVLF